MREEKENLKWVLLTVTKDGQLMILKKHNYTPPPPPKWADCFVDIDDNHCWFSRCEVTFINTEYEEKRGVLPTTLETSKGVNPNVLPSSSQII